jgi:ferredoxin
LHDLTAGLAARGVPPDRIHREIFAGLVAVTPGVVGAVERAPHVPSDDPGSGPLVSFARSGLAVHWSPSKHRSLLELAEACDVPVRWSCRTGVCHSCESGLVSGSVPADTKAPHRRLQKRADDIPEPALRVRYLTNVAVNARVVAPGRALAGPAGG